MKIAHRGFCLEEGLLALSPEVFTLKIDDGKLTLQDALLEFEAAHGRPDMVVIEFLGKYPWKMAQLDELLNYPVPIIAYAADSSINIYYYKYLLKFFDYVFVDQRSSVAELKKYGINAHWLALCVESRFFREPQPKPWGISFVGRVNKERLKRTNILSSLHAALPDAKDFKMAHDISFAQMQDLFAASTATLNENLFDGLTWRVFQALASGTLLLTEDGMDGLDVYFEHEKHLLCYTADTLIPLATDIVKHPDKYTQIAKNGHEICKKYHTSTVRVKELLAYVWAQNGMSFEGSCKATSAKIAKQSFFHKKYAQQHCAEDKSAEIFLNTAASIYYSMQLYADINLSTMVALKNKLPHVKDTLLSVHSLYFLANVAFGTMNLKQAKELFFKALSSLNALVQRQGELLLAKLGQEKECLELEIMGLNKLSTEITCSLALCCLTQKDYSAALKAKSAAIVSLKRFSNHKVDEIFISTHAHVNTLDENGINKLEASICFSLAQVNLCLGNVVELGYCHPAGVMTNSALLLALRAWKKTYHSRVLDFILPNVFACGVIAQVLPGLIDAVITKKVTKAQAEQIYAIAKKAHYDIV